MITWHILANVRGMHAAVYAWVRHNMTDKNRPLGESKRCFQSHFLQKETRTRPCTLYTVMRI